LFDLALPGKLSYVIFGFLLVVTWVLGGTC